MIESQLPVQPLLTPSLPAEATSFPGSHQMSPNLLLYPVSDKRKAFTRIADRKVVHPTSQDSVDLRDHLRHGLADILAEHGFWALTSRAE